jgi:uncharacterized membrane protein
MKHPLHPALVHFPIACWSLATLADGASLWLGAPAWRFAGTMLAIGTAAALLAMATGLVESLKVAADGPAARTVNAHIVAVLAAWLCYATSLFLRWQEMTLVAPSGAGLALSAAGFLALCVAGWLGAQLVYRHGVGVQRAEHDARRR